MELMHIAIMHRAEVYSFGSETGTETLFTNNGIHVTKMPID